MWGNADNGLNVERVAMSRSYAPYESVGITRFVVPARDDADAEYMTFISMDQVWLSEEYSVCVPV